MDTWKYLGMVREIYGHLGMPGDAWGHLGMPWDGWETIKRFRVMDHDFSVETGELTPSQKVKRRVVENMYANLLDEMYTDSR